MRTHIRHLWQVITTGYWFVPALMSVVAGGLAIALLYIDHNVLGEGERLGWLYGGGADGARTMLSTVAGSVITVAGVVFSITIASLTQASSQFGPRLLRNFMRDTSNQVVLGTFVATDLYCLLVLRTIHGKSSDGAAFVPQASITVAVLLAVASLAVLIYFIHHVSVSLQAPEVVASVRQDLSRVIGRLPNEDIDQAKGRGIDPEQPLPNAPPDARAVHTTHEGYIQVRDEDALLAIAQQFNIVLYIDCRPGDYLIRNSVIVRVVPPDSCNDALNEAINSAFICGTEGTPEQDLEYAIRQMVEVAVRALSPGINDPFTAINCIDALGSALCEIADRGLRSTLRYDDANTLRVVLPVSTFDGATDMAFNQIRQYGRDSVAVTIRLLEVISMCAKLMTQPVHCKSLKRHAEMVYRQSLSAINEKHDRADVRRRYESAAAAIGFTPESADES